MNKAIARQEKVEYRGLNDFRRCFMEKDKNVYKKVGRRYVPIGYKLDDNWLSDGIWIVRHRKGCKAITRGDYLADCYELVKAGEIAKIDLPKLGAMDNYAEVVARSLLVNERASLTTIDLARRIVKDLFEYEERRRNDNG